MAGKTELRGRRSQLHHCNKAMGQMTGPALALLYRFVGVALLKGLSPISMTIYAGLSSLGSILRSIAWHTRLKNKTKDNNNRQWTKYG
jgi:hypothetical protein